MALSVDDLVDIARGASSVPTRHDLDNVLEPVLSALASPSDWGSSFVRDSQGFARDYAGAAAAFGRLFDAHENPWAGSTSEMVLNSAVEALGRKGKIQEPRKGTATTSATTSDDQWWDEHLDECDPPLKEAKFDEEIFPFHWVPVMLAALLPVMRGVLPRDRNGICVIPHKHRMELQKSSDEALHFTQSGRLAYRTNKVCDNCQKRIADPQYYHCWADCDIDFCEDCYNELSCVFDDFFKHSEKERERKLEHLVRVVSITERAAAHILRLNAADRVRLANELAFEWPTAMFGQLVQALADVVNAKVVHVQDVMDIQSDQTFWHTIGLLQFLYSANSLPCSTSMVDGQGGRGPRVDYTCFILEGINKCEPISEWQRWRAHPSAQVPDLLSVEKFELTVDFCSFLTHSNLVPISFRRVCLLCDMWDEIQRDNSSNLHRVVPLRIDVRREPLNLLDDVISIFGKTPERDLRPSDNPLRRPLRVTFAGEEAAGPGVTKEFFQVALRCFLDASGPQIFFNFNEQQRTYWFNEAADCPEAFRACGVLLGQAVLNGILVPSVFPRVLYDRLLHDLGSPHAKQLGLDDVASACMETAQSLQAILDYNGHDIEAVFGDLDFESIVHLPSDFKLSRENKHFFVQSYATWFFNERISAQFTPLSEGFRTIVGSSGLLRWMVGAVQLEQIVCGGSVPVDVPAIRRGSAHQGWSEAESEYLELFWSVLDQFSEQERVQFIVFVTASDRVPLRGWHDLQLVIQKNGVGDDNLPTAHTCFCQLLLPRYSSKDKLAANLKLAIANSEGFGLK